MEKSGVDKAWEIMQEYWEKLDSQGKLNERRSSQRLSWLYRVLEGELWGR
jgi:hypothetical protein